MNEALSLSADTVQTIALVAVSAVGALIGGFWAILKLAMTQFEARLEARLKAFNEALEQLRTIGAQRIENLESRYNEVNKLVQQMLIELPREYVARSDYVRRETVMEAKIDQLGLRIENWILKGDKR